MRRQAAGKGARARVPAWRRVFLICVLWGCGLAGCSEARSIDVHTGHLASALDNGLPAGIPDLLAVARFETGSGVCTGTLIAPQVVLTAAHCITRWAQGCDFWAPGNLNVVFADEHGNPGGAGAQTVPVLGFQAHPEAFGERVFSCLDQDVEAECGEGDDLRTEVGTLCALYDIPDCVGWARGYGMRWEHDLALLYLEREPEGIDPIPVIVGEGVANPSHNLFTFPHELGGADQFSLLPTATPVRE